MKILYITNIFPDIRSKKIIDSLISSGHEVDVISIGEDSRKAYPAEIEKIRVLYIGEFSKFYYFPLNPLYLSKVLKFTKNKNYDLIFQRDIFQTFNVQLVKKILNVKHSIIDIADNYPETAEKSKLQKFTLKKILNKAERIAIKNNNLILTVTNSSAVFLKTKHKLKFKSIVVHNYPSKVPNIKFKPKVFKPFLVYIGSYDVGIRNLELLFKLKKEILKEYKDFRIYIHSYDINKIKDLARKYSFEEYIYDGGLLAYSELHEKLSDYNIGIIPHVRSKATDFTEPNKLYDYLHAYLPVITSDNPSLIETIDKNEVGSYYKDESDFINKMRYIEKNYNNIRMNIYEKKSNFTWEKDFREVINFINEVKS